MSAPKAQEYDSRRETNQMKYGIYFAYWEKEWNVDQKKYISKVKDLGFDILEISCAMLKNISKNELLEMKKMAEDAGVMLTAGYGPNAKENLGSSDPEVVKNAIAFYTDILKKLEILDIHTIGGGIYSYWPVDYSKPIDKAGDWARSVANVRTVGKIAGECGVEYCLEVLNRFEGYLLNTCAEAKQFVEEVDVPAVKIMLDTFHMNIEEPDCAESIRKAGKRIGHVHVADSDRWYPGHAHYDFASTFSALKEVGYERAVALESFLYPDPETAARRALEKINSYLK